MALFQTKKAMVEALVEEEVREIPSPEWKDTWRKRYRSRWRRLPAEFVFENWVEKICRYRWW